MKITAINGSPQKYGRMSRVVDEIISGIEENGHAVEVICLRDLDLKDCAGCLSCQEKGFCVIRDDITVIEDAITRSDVIIWASPTHWANVSGLMLRAFERLFGFLIREKPQGFPEMRNGRGKKAVLVTACSTPRPIDWLYNQSRSCLNRMREVCRYGGMKVVGAFVLPGTIRMKDVPEKYLARARALGRTVCR